MALNEEVRVSVIRESTVSPEPVEPAGPAGPAAPVGHVDEQQSRAVAEAAREQEWRKPSFAKGLYLGPGTPIRGPPSGPSAPATGSKPRRAR